MNPRAAIRRNRPVPPPIPEGLQAFRGYRVRDVARATGIPVSSIYEAIRSGRLRAVRYGSKGAALVILETDLRQFLHVPHSVPTGDGTSAS
jgi:excisionase family DNA binding protein